MKRARSKSSDEETHRFPIEVRMDVSRAIDKLGKKMNWSMSFTSAALIEEALYFRRLLGPEAGTYVNLMPGHPEDLAKIRANETNKNKLSGKTYPIQDTEGDTNRRQKS